MAIAMVWHQVQQMNQYIMFIECIPLIYLLIFWLHDFWQLKNARISIGFGSGEAKGRERNGEERDLGENSQSHRMQRPRRCQAAGQRRGGMTNGKKVTFTLFLSSRDWLSGTKTATMTYLYQVQVI